MSWKILLATVAAGAVYAWCIAMGIALMKPVGWASTGFPVLNAFPLMWGVGASAVTMLIGLVVHHRLARR